MKALQEIAALRQQSVDMRRLCMELAGHYRTLMLSALPGGTDLLTGTSPEEEAAYAARKDFPQEEAVRAVNAFGAALEKMARGTDQRIELELAVFSLTQPEAVPVALPAAVPARPVVTAASPAPFAAAPQQVPPVQMASAPVPPVAAQPVPPTVEPPPFSAPTAGETPPFEPELAPAAPAVQQPTPAQQPVYAADVPIPKPVRTVAKEPQLFPQWQAVLELIAENDPMLNSYLRGTQAYYDGRRVLIECSDDFRDFMRRSKETSKNIKQYIYQVTHIKCGIGPYEKTAAAVSNAPAADVEETLRQMKNIVRRATLLAQDKLITLNELSELKSPVAPSAAGMPLRNEETEKQQIIEALKQTGYNKSRAAQLLGIDRKTLYNKLKLYGIEL